MNIRQMFMDGSVLALQDFKNKKAFPKTPVVLPKPVKVPPTPASAKPTKP